WSVLRIPAWRTLAPDVLDRQIQDVIRRDGFGAVRVVERHGADPGSTSGLVATLPMVASHMLTTLSLPARASWLAWTWGLAMVLRPGARPSPPRALNWTLSRGRCRVRHRNPDRARRRQDGSRQEDGEHAWPTTRSVDDRSRAELIEHGRAVAHRVDQADQDAAMPPAELDREHAHREVVGRCHGQAVEEEHDRGGCERRPRTGRRPGHREQRHE